MWSMCRHLPISEIVRRFYAFGGPVGGDLPSLSAGEHGGGVGPGRVVAGVGAVPGGLDLPRRQHKHHPAIALSRNVDESPRLFNLMTAWKRLEPAFLSSRESLVQSTSRRCVTSSRTGARARRGTRVRRFGGGGSPRGWRRGGLSRFPGRNGSVGSARTGPWCRSSEPGAGPCQR